MHTRNALKFHRAPIKHIFLMMAVLILGKTVQAKDALSFGVVPQQSAAKLAALWIPLLQEVEQRSGIKLRFSTAPDIPTFERRLAAGEYDISYMNPYHYTVFSRAPGYRAIAKVSNKRIKGIIVVRKESPVSDVKALQGKTLAFPAPAAFAASVLPRTHFEKMGVAITPRYVGSHDSVYLSVARGFYPAGGGVVRTLNNLDRKLQEQLRILWTSDGFTPHAFAVHPRLESKTRQQVITSLLSLGNDDPGRAVLAALELHSLEKAIDSDWDDVRALGIRLLEETAALEKTP